MLLSSTAALVFLALLFLDMGEPAAAIVQLSLAGGFLAATGFLAPELGGVKRGAVRGLGVAGALVLLVVLVHLGSRVEPPNPRLEEWAPLAVAMASAPLASVLLALRLVIGGGAVETSLLCSLAVAVLASSVLYMITRYSSFLRVLVGLELVVAASLASLVLWGGSLGFLVLEWG